MISDVPALALDAIDKKFDGVAALDAASFDLRWGEVHGLLGENGAGKSTLMNIVCGLYSADRGNLLLNGEVTQIKGPAQATALSIGMVHQHFKLVSSFTVAENILLACAAALPTKTLAAAGKAVEQAAQELGFAVAPDSLISELSVAEQQRVEILKQVILGASILILDEPTSVLTDSEATAVLQLLRRMAESGKAVVLITHRLREVLDYADRITVMRAGQTVLDGMAAAELNPESLAAAMVGEKLAEPHRPIQETATERPIRLRLSGLSVVRRDGSQALKSVSLEVKGGEILGVAGVGGNGQTELSEVIYGLIDKAEGQVFVDEQEVTRLSPGQRRDLGIRLIPADRFAYSLLPNLRAYENLAIANLRQGAHGPVGWLNRRSMREKAKSAFSDRNIIGGQPETRTRLFSGGNAQKILLARELSDRPAVLVAHSPTRGLDVKACLAVHEAIVTAVEGGAACLLISEDLEEVLKLSNRIVVMNRGQLEGPFQTEATQRAQIGALMAGHA